MQRQTTDEMKALYDQSSGYIDGIITARNQLLPMLAGLDGHDREQINVAMREFVQSRHDKESFVAPDIFTALPSVSRSVDALDGFMRKALPDGDPRKLPGALTNIETAQANMRWEPFDQLWSSAIALDAALDKAAITDPGVKAALRTQTKQILDNCMQIDNSGGEYRETGGLGFVLSGSGSREGARKLDVLFPEAVHELSGKPPVQASEATKLQQLAHRTDEIVDAQGRLETCLAAFSAPDKQHITAMVREYGAQCLPESERPMLQDAVTKLLNNGAESVSGGVLGLQDTLARIRVPSASPSKAPGREAVAQDPWQAVNTLRVPVRALSAILDAENTAQDGAPFEASNMAAPGKYDEALNLANAVAGKCWNVQVEIGQDKALRERIQRQAAMGQGRQAG